MTAQQFRISKIFTPEAIQWLRQRATEPRINDYHRLINGFGDHMFRLVISNVPAPSAEVVAADARIYQCAQTQGYNNDGITMRLGDYLVIYTWVNYDPEIGGSIGIINNQPKVLQINIIASNHTPY